MSNNQKRIAWPALLLLVGTLLTAFLIVSGRESIEAKPTVAELSPANALALATPPIRSRVQVVRFTLYDVGIYPQEARVQTGLVAISIEDLTGTSTQLVVERIEGEARVPVGVVNRVANRLRARADLPLPVGRYQLSDASRRSNQATLVVEP